MNERQVSSLLDTVHLSFIDFVIFNKKQRPQVLTFATLYLVHQLE